MKRYLILLAMVVSSLIASSQQHDPVLLKIDGKEITRSQFQFRYTKEGKGIPVKEYLELFINNQLKIAEAESLGLDTTSAFRSELDAYHRNSAKTYFLNALTGFNAPTRSKNRSSHKRKNKVCVEGIHVYKYLPQNTPAWQVKKIENQMDSIYRAIRNNSSVDFTQWVNRYSDDKDTFRVCRLHMPEEFEKVVFGMNKGDVSKPFFTPQGIHIVKVLDKKSGLSDHPALMISLKDINDEAFLNKIKAEADYTPNQEALEELRTKGKSHKILFTIAGKPYTGKDFENFSQDNTKSLHARINDFIRKSLYNYENSKLNAEHPDFRLAEQEYKDKILLTYMDRGLTNKVQNAAGLEAYFKAHKKQYRWELPRYKGVVVHAKDKKTGKRIKKQLKKIPENQRLEYLQKTYNQLTEEVKAVQGTFAVAENDYVDKMIFKVGKRTPLETHPFTVLVGKKVKGPESYEEVREAVMNDFRKYLEGRRVAYLRKKSKVEINQEVIKTVNNH